MAPALQEIGLDRLSMEDRLAVADALWESVVAEVEAEPVTEAQRAELDRRRAAAAHRPDARVPWETVKAEALARSRR